MYWIIYVRSRECWCCHWGINSYNVKSLTMPGYLFSLIVVVAVASCPVVFGRVIRLKFRNWIVLNDIITVLRQTIAETVGEEMTTSIEKKQWDWHLFVCAAIVHCTVDKLGASRQDGTEQALDGNFCYAISSDVGGSECKPIVTVDLDGHTCDVVRSQNQNGIFDIVVGIITIITVIIVFDQNAASKRDRWRSIWWTVLSIDVFPPVCVTTTIVASSKTTRAWCAIADS